MAIDAAQLKVRVTADTRDAESGLNAFSGKMKSLAGTVGSIGRAMAFGIGASAVAAGTAAFKVGMDFESAFAGVTKTVDGTAEEMQVLRQGIRDLATELPASAVEIANVAESAGALGIAKENILDFTEVMINLGETTNLTADQAATDLAQFANITKMDPANYERLGSTIVALGNDGASTEAQIVGMAQRIAGAGEQIGLTEQQTLAWASAAASLGLEVEAGGTAISRAFVETSKSVSKGGKDLQKFAKVAGVSARDFAEAFEEDASGAVRMLIGGLGELDAQGINTFQVLEDLGFADARVQDTLLRLASGTEVLDDALETANRAWEENTALVTEAEKRYATTQSKLAILGNELKDMGISMFDTFKPAIEWSIDGLTNFVAGVGDAFAEVSGGLEQIRTTGVGAFDIGPISVDWTPEEKTVSLDTSFLDVVVGWTEELKTVDLHTSFLDVIVKWTEESKTVALDTSFLDVIVNWTAETKVIDVSGFFGSAVVNWSPVAKFIRLDTLFLDVFVDWFPETKTVEVGTSFADAIVKWNPETKTTLIDLTSQFGDATVKWTPEEKVVTVGGLVGTITPEVIGFTLNEKSVLRITPEIIGFTLGDNANLFVSPEITSFSLGDSVGVVLTEKNLKFQLGDLSVKVTPEFTAIDWGAVFGMTRNADGSFEIRFTGTLKEIDDAIGDYKAAVAGNVLGIKSDILAITASIKSWQTSTRSGLETFEDNVNSAIDAMKDTSPDWVVNLLEWSPPIPKWVEALLQWAGIGIGPRANQEGVQSGGTIGREALPSLMGLALGDLQDRGSEMWSIPIRPEVQLDNVLDALRASGDIPMPIPAILEPQTEQMQPVPVPIQLESIAGQDVGGILEAPKVQVEATIIPMVIPEYTDPSYWVPQAPEIPVELKFPTLSSIMADFAPIQEGLSSILSSVGDVVKAGGDTPLKADVQVGEVKPPAVMPVIQVKGELVNDLSQAGSGINAAITQGASALSSSLSGFSWPDLPDWQWPALPTFTWPALPKWDWPPIPAPTWLDRLQVPRPGWLGELLSWTPTVVIAQQAATVPGQLAGGTNYWRGGLTWVGEQGPELVDLRRGAKVYDHQESMAMAAGAGGVNVTVHANVSNELDLETVAYKIAQIIRRREG